MYRSKRISLNSEESFEVDNENSIQSLEENKENREIKTENKDNDSISEMFKKLSLHDRKSICKNNNDENIKEEFMTSSPIQGNSKLIKPIFTKPELEDHNEHCTADTINNIEDELVQRSQTVVLTKKPSLIKVIQEEEEEEEEELKLENKTEENPRRNLIKRSASISRWTVSLISQKQTVPKPFSFENKDKALLENRQKLLENDILEKKKLASSFRANPMPISSPIIPEKKLIKPTKVIPFNFESEERIQQQKERSRNKMTFNNNNDTSSSNSRTITDISYLHKSPFKPKQSKLTPTCPVTPQLSLDSRLEKRKEFDKNIQAKDEMLLKLKKEYEEECFEKEKEELKKLRNEHHIVKANPIRTFKNIDIVHNPKKTVPVTPKFSDRFKK